MNLKKTIYLNVTLLPIGAQTKLLTLFSLKIFFIYHLELLISQRISKKIINGLNRILMAMVETDSCKKNWGKKSLDTVPLNVKTFRYKDLKNILF